MGFDYAHSRAIRQFIRDPRAVNFLRVRRSVRITRTCVTRSSWVAPSTLTRSGWSIPAGMQYDAVQGRSLTQSARREDPISRSTVACSTKICHARSRLRHGAMVIVPCSTRAPQRVRRFAMTWRWRATRQAFGAPVAAAGVGTCGFL